MKRLAQITAIMMILGTASFAKASCGVVEVSKGDVKITSGGKTSPASAGAKICSGDTITAAVDSRAKLKMEDGNELNISPSSKIVIETYQFNAADNKKKVMLNVLMGKVRATTPKEGMYGDKSKDGTTNSFQVKTKSAVAGVRGTDFLTGYDPSTKKSEVVTFRGKVEVGQPGPGGQILKPVTVGAGQKTEAVAGQAPATPKVVPASELKQMNSESKAETGGSSDKSAGSGSGEKKKDGEKKDDAKSDDKKSGDAKSDGDKGGDKKGDDGGKSSAAPDKSADTKSDSKSDSKSDGGSSSNSANRSPASSGSGSSGSSAGNTSTSPSSGGIGSVAAPPPPPPVISAPVFSALPSIPVIPKAPELPPSVNNAIQNSNTKAIIKICVNGKC